MARYISSNEAIWRILDFQIHQRYIFCIPGYYSISDSFREWAKNLFYREKC